MSESTLERRSGKLYKTVRDTALREGVSTNPSESNFICNIGAGTEVLVTHAQGRRAYIVRPHEGWVSLQRSNGEMILEPVDDTIKLVKKNFSVSTTSQIKRTVPQEAYNISYKWDHQRNILRKVLIPNDLIDMKTVNVITGISVKNSSVVPGLACIAICTMSYPEINEIHSRKEVVRLTNRAIDGYACFREKEAFLKLYESFADYREFLRVEKNLQNQVNVVMVNRNGLFDKEGFGLASLFGSQFKVTTLGIVPRCTAQRYVQKAYGSTEQLFVAQPSFEGETMLTQAEVDEQIGNALQKPNCVDIKHGTSVLCCALKLVADEDPIYVSVGHGCCLESAVDLCRKSSKGSNVPEPLLRANRATDTTMSEQDTKYQLLEKMRSSPAVSPMSIAFGGVAVGDM